MQIAHASTRPLPVARRRNLIVKELPDETLIYDLDSDQAHCLNHTAALVWKNCDGDTSVSALCSLLEKEVSNPVAPEVVWLALDQLYKFRLLEGSPALPAKLAGIKRRELIKRIGLAALTLPVIMSISTPTAAQAGSPCSCTGNNCRPTGCPCMVHLDCVNKCSGGICT
jgi:hypothetical protein